MWRGAQEGVRRRGGSRQEPTLLQKTEDVTGRQGLGGRGRTLVRILRSVLFLLRPPVLKPDFHLCFGEVELPRQFGALAAHHVLTALELELEPVQLLCRERRPRAFWPVQVQAFWQHDFSYGSLGVSDQDPAAVVRVHSQEFVVAVFAGGRGSGGGGARGVRGALHRRSTPVRAQRVGSTAVAPISHRRGLVKHLRVSAGALLALNLAWTVSRVCARGPLSACPKSKQTSVQSKASLRARHDASTEETKQKFVRVRSCLAVSPGHSAGLVGSEKV